MGNGLGHIISLMLTTWAEPGMVFICVTLTFSVLEIVVPFNYDSNHCHFPLWNEEAIFLSYLLKINVEMEAISFVNEQHFSLDSLKIHFNVKITYHYYHA